MNCRTCDSKKIEEIFAFKEKSWFLCLECLALQRMPVPQNLDTFLTDNEGYSWGTTSPRFTEQDFQRQVQCKRARLLRFLKLGRLESKNLKLFDFGSGTGPLLEAAKELNISAIGLEASRRNSGFSKDRGHEVRSGYLDHFEWKTAEFNVVNMENSYNFAVTPAETLRKLREMLADDGLLFWTEKEYHFSARNVLYNLSHTGQIMYLSRPGIENLMRLSGFKIIHYRNRLGEFDLIARKGEFSRSFVGSARVEKAWLKVAPMMDQLLPPVANGLNRVKRAIRNFSRLSPTQDLR